MIEPLPFDCLTIGHSDLSMQPFLARLKTHAIAMVADVRSVPYSRRFPWFSARALARRLEAEGIAYAAFGRTLGGRPADPTLYRDGIADYEAMAATREFQEGLAQVLDAMRRRRLCLMCAEREPLDCHRCLLIGRALAARGVRLGHILGDGTVEPHHATEARLLATADDAPGLFGDTSLADAYRLRARRIAARRAGFSGNGSGRPGLRSGEVRKRVRT